MLAPLDALVTTCDDHLMVNNQPEATGSPPTPSTWTSSSHTAACATMWAFNQTGRHRRAARHYRVMTADPEAMGRPVGADPPCLVLVLLALPHYLCNILNKCAFKSLGDIDKLIEDSSRTLPAEKDEEVRGTAHFEGELAQISVTRELLETINLLQTKTKGHWRRRWRRGLARDRVCGHAAAVARALGAAREPHGVPGVGRDGKGAGARAGRLLLHDGPLPRLVDNMQFRLSHTLRPRRRRGRQRSSGSTWSAPSGTASTTTSCGTFPAAPPHDARLRQLWGALSAQILQVLSLFFLPRSLRMICVT